MPTIILKELMFAIDLIQLIIMLKTNIHVKTNIG